MSARFVTLCSRIQHYNPAVKGKKKNGEPSSAPRYKERVPSEAVLGEVKQPRGHPEAAIAQSAVNHHLYSPPIFT